MYSYVYILANKRNGTMYVGATSNLKRRIAEHKNGTKSGFTKRYSVQKLVYYETAIDESHAFVREKQIKKWNRDWKKQLIENVNPTWGDLYETL